MREIIGMTDEETTEVLVAGGIAQECRGADSSEWTLSASGHSMVRVPSPAPVETNSSSKTPS